MVRLGFSLQPQYGCSFSQVVDLLCDSGFSAISPLWSPELPMEELAARAQKHRMSVQSLHAPHKGIEHLWNPGDPLSAASEQGITDCIDACARFQIPIAVVHGWRGLIYTFPEEPLDYSVFDRIVNHAEKRNVSIAFENLEGEEYLQALMSRYRGRAHIGYCWDSGHDHCYPHKTDFLNAYGSRLIMTHLNDNLGLRDPGGIPAAADDLHLLPYDGNIQWESALAPLKNLPKQEILNFELKMHPAHAAAEDLIYGSLSTEEYFRLAGRRARQIADLYETITDTKTA